MNETRVKCLPSSRLPKKLTMYILVRTQTLELLVKKSLLKGGVGVPQIRKEIFSKFFHNISLLKSPGSLKNMLLKK